MYFKKEFWYEEDILLHTGAGAYMFYFLAFDIAHKALESY
jgi:hypothetical protein